MDALTRLLPRLVITITVVVLGWLIAMLLRGLVRLVLGWLRFGAAAERFGIAAPSDRRPAPGRCPRGLHRVGARCWIGFLVSGIDVLGFASLQGLVSSFAGFVPRLMVALVILRDWPAGGELCVASDAARRGQRAHLPSPRLVSGAVRWLILIVVGAMALGKSPSRQTIVLMALRFLRRGHTLALAIALPASAPEGWRGACSNKPSRSPPFKPQMSHL